MKTRWLVVGAFGAVAAAAALYMQLAREPERQTVFTARVTRGDVVETVDATGTLQAVTTVQVGTQVSGTIKALHADFNSQVRRGQVIAELDPSLFQTQVEQARATVLRLEAEAGRASVQLEEAERKRARARDLWARQLVSAADLEAAELSAREAEATVNAARAQITQARASLNQSEVNLAHTIIRAPIDGIVISRNVDVGQTVAASMQAPTLFVIARDLTAMRVEASIAESDVGRIETGQTAAFTVDAYPGTIFNGTVSQVRLQPVIEQNVVSYVTIIDVPNPDLRLKPGMTANVTVEIARANGVLRVPNAALRVRPSAEVLAALGQPEAAETKSSGDWPGMPAGSATAAPREPDGGAHGQVWVMTDGRLTRVPVRLGVSDGSATAVLGGRLDEGTEVVTGVSGNASTAPPSTTSPLLPSRGRGPGAAGRSPVSRTPGA